MARRLALIVFDRRGVVTGEWWDDFDAGRWEVTDDGQYCRTWQAWDLGRRRCYRVYQTAEGVEFHAVDRWIVDRARRVTVP